MFKIIDIATNQEFELPSNIRIPFMLFNPIFEEQGSTTFSAPMSGQSAVNRRLTGYQHRPGKQNNSGKLIPVWLDVSGQRKRCTLNIIEADSDDIKWNLLMDEGSFIAAHGDKKLNELDFGGEQTISGAGLPNYNDVFYTKTFPEVNCAFPPIYNTQYFDGTQFETNYKTYGKILNRPENLEAGYFGINPKCPAPFLNYIINRIFETYGSKVVENSLTIMPFNNLILLNNVDNSKTQVHVISGTAVVGASETSDQGHYDLKNHVPSKTIKSFLSSLRGKFNVIPFINESSGTVSLLCFDDILKQPVTANLSEFASSLKLKNIPEYTGFEFIYKGEVTPAFSVFDVDFNEYENKLVLPEVNVSALQNGYFKLNGVYKVINDSYFLGDLGSAFYQLVINEAGTGYEWKNLGYSEVGNIYIGDKANRLKFETEFGMTFNAGFMFQGAYMPQYDAQGISELIEFNPDKNFGMILAFYKKATPTKQYPDASYEDGIYLAHDFENTLINGTDKGTVNRFFKRTMDFYLNRGRIFSGNLSLPVSKLLNFNFAKKYTIHQGTYMVKNIKGYFTMNGVEYDDDNCELVEV